MSALVLDRLDPATFQHLVNALALRVLGPGLAMFSPGPDGGRDGYFRGEAPYPSTTERWQGRWYIQSKFHAPHLSTNAQAWLVNEVTKEIERFAQPGSRREWPDIWILASNIDPSGVPRTGAFDKCREIVARAHPQLADRFEIWGGSKILELLSLHPTIADRYGVTSGQALTSILSAISDERAPAERVLRFLIEDELLGHRYTKLEQAGASLDIRPGIHHLFTDLPVETEPDNTRGLLAGYLFSASAESHREPPGIPVTDDWQRWRTRPERAPRWFIKGGPGQGKSTACQYYAQVQRAAILLSTDTFTPSSDSRALAEEVRARGAAPRMARLASNTHRRGAQGVRSMVCNS